MLKLFYNSKLKKKNNKSFSLIELSIVLIIIGLLITGVVGSKILMKKARLSGARLLTLSSPIPQIEDLVYWLEPVLDGAFQDVNGATVEWGGKVNTWVNKAGFSGKMSANATQTTDSLRPIALEEGVNKLPVLSFTNASLILNNSPKFTNEFTLFFVGTQTTTSTQVYLMGGSGWGASPALLSNSTTAFTWYNPNESEVISTTASSGLHAIALRRKDKEDLDIFFDGALAVSKQASTADANDFEGDSLVSIGSEDGIICNYVGEIAEIAIYDRFLTDDEILKIQNYFMQKYKIN